MVVCIVWGTTYLCMRIGVETFPPLLFSAIRHGSAGLALLGFLLITGKFKKVSQRDLIRQMVPGVFMVALGNGIMGWCEQFIPSSLAALIVSVMPVYVVAINFVTGIDSRIPNRYILSGLLLGCVGVGLIFKDNVKDLANPDYVTGVLVAFVASLSWASGSVYSKFKPAQTSPLMSSAIQLTSGGFILLIGGLLFDDLGKFGTISNESIYALIYLILFGSILGYICFMYALEKLPVGLVSIYAYINPFIAILLGYLILDEAVSWITGLALLSVLSGVWFINKGYAVEKG